MAGISSAICNFKDFTEAFLEGWGFEQFENAANRELGNDLLRRSSRILMQGTLERDVDPHAGALDREPLRQGQWA